MSGMRARGWRRQGQGQVLLVEGEPGTGKSLLLARAGEEAGHRGFLLVAAAAGELSPAPLLAAVNAARATPEYGRLGARRGVARTRRRLRQLGVRRRYWASERRPTGDWAGLTDIEQATARLVAEGLTNQQIADQLFISTHTVAFHLRQVFRRLDISSRVDLARIALEHARPGDGETP